MTRRTTSPLRRLARSSTASSGDENLSAFSITLTSACSSCAGSTSTGGMSSAARRRRDRRRPRSRRARGRRGRRLSTARASASRRRPRDARARADWRRAVESLHLDEDRRRQLVPSRSGERLAQLPSTSLAVMIAVIGERRSWLTERSTAVFTASLRRSASASTASRRRRASLARASLPSAHVRSRSPAETRPPSKHAQRRPERRELQHRGRADRRRDRPPEARTRSPRPARAPLELDPAVRRPQKAGDARRDLLSTAAPPALEQTPRLGRQRRLAPALLGLVRAPSRSRGEPAHADRRHEVDGERDPVLRVREPSVRRREEEPVEGEHADDRDRDRERQAPERRDGQHGEEVEDAEAQHGRDRLESPDVAPITRDRAEAEQRCARLSKQPRRSRTSSSARSGLTCPGYAPDLKSPQDSPKAGRSPRSRG